MNNTGVMSIGVKAPIIKKGDNLSKIVVDSILKTTKTYFPYPNNESYYYDIDDRDIIGITESVVARSVGNYVTVNDIANELIVRFGENKKFILINPIYSRNRFSMILKAIARAAKEVVIYMPEFDEVGNPSGVNQFTGVNIKEYYEDIINNEGKKCWIRIEDPSEYENENNSVTIYCGLHDYGQWKEDYEDDTHITLADICSDKCEYGLLGSNKATEEKLKLFPDKKSSQVLVENVQRMIYEITNKKVEVMIYGDGCFKDPIGGIWEFADPVVSPAFTDGLSGTPNEIKIKAFADDKFGSLSGDELINAVKNEIRNKDSNLVGNMASQGTTPRRFTDLLGSLMDLTSGSGDKGSPIVLVKNYFNNYSTDTNSMVERKIFND